MLDFFLSHRILLSPIEVTDGLWLEVFGGTYNGIRELPLPSLMEFTLHLARARVDPIMITQIIVIGLIFQHADKAGVLSVPRVKLASFSLYYFVQGGQADFNDDLFFASSSISCR